MSKPIYGILPASSKPEDIERIRRNFKEVNEEIEATNNKLSEVIKYELGVNVDLRSRIALKRMIDNDFTRKFLRS